MAQSVWVVGVEPIKPVPDRRIQAVKSGTCRVPTWTAPTIGWHQVTITDYDPPRAMATRPAPR